MEANVAHNLFGNVRDYAPREAITSVGVADGTSTVFVIDSDISVHQSLELLIRTAA
jgi:hypothetical protein